jgi:hypothetical protein
LIESKSPDEVFQPGMMYQVSNITNGVRVYRGEELTYLEYSVKGVQVEYVMKMIQSVERWNEWNIDIKNANVINQV